MVINQLFELRPAFGFACKRRKDLMFSTSSANIREGDRYLPESIGSKSRLRLIGCGQSISALALPVRGWPAQGRP